MNLTSTVSLNNGVEIPRLGLGVFRSPAGEITRTVVSHALLTGYRHIDTARIYGNEADVGAAVRASDIPRAEIFVSTKLWNDDQGYDAALDAFAGSLKRLGLDYVDLYLIHWPVPEKRRESWRALEQILAEGRARTIGVSNYMEHHLQELLDECRTIPAVNQIELSPYNYLSRWETLQMCARHSIAVEAYSPLTRGLKLDDPPLCTIAKRYEKSPAQILLRWLLQKGCIILPKSVSPARIRENADVFDFNISPEDMEVLEALDENLSTGWNPLNAP